MEGRDFLNARSSSGDGRSPLQQRSFGDGFRRIGLCRAPYRAGAGARGLARAGGGAPAGPRRIPPAARRGRANRGGAGQPALSRVDPGGDRGRERGRQRRRRQAPERTAELRGRPCLRRRRDRARGGGGRASAPSCTSPASAPTRASRNPYIASKGRGEAATREAFAGAIVLRPSIVFGPEDEFFNRFAALARVLPALPLFGGGATKLQPVFVGDVALAAARALDDATAAGRTYELGGPEVMSLREAVERTLRIIERRRALVPLPFGVSRLVARVDGIRERDFARPLPEDADDDARRDRAAASRQRGLRRGDRRRAHVARSRRRPRRASRRSRPPISIASARPANTRAAAPPEAAAPAPRATIGALARARRGD